MLNSQIFRLKRNKVLIVIKTDNLMNKNRIVAFDLKNGTTKTMDNLNLGDVLKDGSRVLVTMKIEIIAVQRASRADPVYNFFSIQNTK